MSRYQQQGYQQQGYQQAPYQDDYAENYINSYTDRGDTYGGQQHPSQQHNAGYADDSQAYDKQYQRDTGAYPMSSSNPYASAGSQSPRGFDAPKKNNRKKWLWICLGLLALVVIGAVLGGVLGTQLNKNKDDNHSSNASNDNNNGNSNTGLPSGVSATNTNTATGANGQRILAVATDSDYMLPVYATGTNTAGYSAPTTTAQSNNGKWPDDNESVSNSSIRAHPRIGAPGYKWTALTSYLIANDPYLNSWNDTIVANATDVLDKDPVAYVTDGGLDGSGVLDIAREMKVRVKNLAYAYKVTNNTAFAERAWTELQTAAGNTSTSFGADGTRWNPAHFLDVGEFTAMFAIGYDWLYDYWSDEQRDALMWSILNLGLNFGYLALSGDQAASTYNWWAAPGIKGNWNCVCNGGMVLGALAIIDRDPTGLAQRTLDLAIPSARNACFQAAHSSGTWAETANYWYFGTTGAAEMVSALITSYGDDRGLTTETPGWNLTSLYHIYAQGMTSLFNYGDHGPNKFSSTANSLFLWATVFNEPRYALYQRDRYDASEPWSMFWYNPESSGTWWDGLPLDRHFDSTEGNWATGRSNWADNEGTYWAMKSGLLTGHQTHGDLDLGDFVFDAQGQRWFGELGSGEYLSPQYFTSEAQDAVRWLYYRKRTEGQNTILINYENQNVNAAPTQNWGSTGTSQGPAPSFDISGDDSAFFTQDMSSAYNATVKRGVRYLNGRKQMLIQDDISGVPSGQNIQWRAHTNASVSLNSATATLTLGGQTLIASIVQGPSGAAFSTQAPTPVSQDPPIPSPTGEQKGGDPENPGVTVLVVENSSDGNAFSLQIALNPQWSESTNYVSPANVPIDNWSLTSHN